MRILSRLPQTVAVLVLGSGFGSASAQPVLCNQPQVASCAKLAPQSKRVRIMVAATTLKCDASDTACRNIVVTVYPKDLKEGREACVAELPYDLFEVSKAQVGRAVGWKLSVSTGASGFGFAQTDGIQMALPASSPASAADAWNPPVTSPNRQRVAMKVKNVIPAVWCHYPRVVDPSGETCCPRDPVIANDPV
jgi:hypothetical protein